MYLLNDSVSQAPAASMNRGNFGVRQGFNRVFGAAAGAVRSIAGRVCMALAALALLGLMTGYAMATGTDISGTVSDLSSLWTSIEGLAIAVILFVLGRKLLRKV